MCWLNISLQNILILIFLALSSRILMCKRSYLWVQNPLVSSFLYVMPYPDGLASEVIIIEIGFNLMTLDIYPQ